MSWGISNKRTHRKTYTVLEMSLQPLHSHKLMPSRPLATPVSVLISALYFLYFSPQWLPSACYTLLYLDQLYFWLADTRVLFFSPASYFLWPIQLISIALLIQINSWLGVRLSVLCHSVCKLFHPERFSCVLLNILQPDR